MLRVSRSFFSAFVSGFTVWGAIVCLAISFNAIATAAAEPPKTFEVQGTVKQIENGGTRLLIAHDAIPGYMPAMSMPFQVRDTHTIAGLSERERVQFQLHVTADESWIDHVVVIARPPTNHSAEKELSSATPAQHARHPLLDFTFTNELGQPVRLSDFRGQALAITFFFTRCPIPDFCPRLSKNFQAVEQRLAAMPNAPTNWHLLSVTFDPEHDTPPVLAAYAKTYHYDPAHWSFITGPPDKVRELATSSDVSFTPDSGLFNHDFRTLIIDANGHLQMVFPTSGDLSDSIVAELLKAAAPANHNS